MSLVDAGPRRSANYFSLNPISLLSFGLSRLLFQAPPPFLADSRCTPLLERDVYKFSLSCVRSLLTALSAASKVAILQCLASPPSCSVWALDPLSLCLQAHFAVEDKVDLSNSPGVSPIKLDSPFLLGSGPSGFGGFGAEVRCLWCVFCFFCFGLVQCSDCWCNPWCGSLDCHSESGLEWHHPCIQRLSPIGRSCCEHRFLVHAEVLGWGQGEAIDDLEFQCAL